MYFGIYCVYYVYCVSLPPKPRLPCGFTETLLGVTAPFPETHCRPCSAVPLYCGNVNLASSPPSSAAACVAPLYL